MVERPDTLRIAANGMWTSTNGTSTFRTAGDSVFVQRPEGEHAYTARLIPARLVLSGWTTFDFDADGLPEAAIRATDYRRLAIP
jgi:hypothetical protein